jgi:autophagy-related protein 2
MSQISGFSTLYDALNDIWAPDVKANQLADVLAGVTPLRSVVNVGSGMADLVLLPLENFRQDGRISRGLQRGAKSFAKTTALEALRLGANLAAGTQVILEKAEHALGPRNVEDGSSGGLGDFGNAEEQSIMVTPASKYAQQPASVKAGLSAAYQSLSSNLTQAAQTILAVPMEVHERSENVSSFGDLMRNRKAEQRERRVP